MPNLRNQQQFLRISIPCLLPFSMAKEGYNNADSRLDVDDCNVRPMCQGDKNAKRQEAKLNVAHVVSHLCNKKNIFHAKRCSWQSFWREKKKIQKRQTRKRLLSLNLPIAECFNKTMICDTCSSFFLHFFCHCFLSSGVLRRQFCVNTI